MTRIAIAFGSNVGDTRENTARAIIRLREHVYIEAVSANYLTEPMYEPDQSDFLNGALVGRTDLGPFGLLAALKSLEGPRLPARNSPRVIDLDLIAYGRLVLRSPRLTLPHPRLAERRFVLEPLAEIAPDLVIPSLGRVAELAAAPELRSQQVRRMENEVSIRNA